MRNGQSRASYHLANNLAWSKAAMNNARNGRLAKRNFVVLIQPIALVLKCDLWNLYSTYWKFMAATIYIDVRKDVSVNTNSTKICLRLVLLIYLTSSTVWSIIQRYFLCLSANYYISLQNCGRPECIPQAFRRNINFPCDTRAKSSNFCGENNNNY